MSSVDKSSSSPEENPYLLTGRNWLERLLIRLIASHTPKCQEVVKLLSQSMEANLPITMRIKLRFHYFICVWCLRYEKQLRALRKVSSSLAEHVDDFCPEALPASSKERLKQALRRKKT
jgi:hypothetical protein